MLIPEFKKIAVNASFLGVAQFVTLILPLAVLPFLGHVLGADGLGSLVFAISAAQMLSIVSEYGFGLSATKEIAQNRDDRAVVSNVWFDVSLIKVAISALSFFLMIGVALFTDSERQTLIIFAFPLVFGNALLPVWFFQGLERVKLISLLQLSGKLVAAMLIFAMVNDKEDLRLAVLLQSSGPILGAFLSYWALVREVAFQELRKPSLVDLARYLREGWHVFVSSVAINIYTTGSTFVVGLLVSAPLLAQYYIAERCLRAVLSIQGPISQALFPHASVLAARGVDYLVIFNRRVVRAIMPMSFAMSVLVFLLADFLISRIFGADYEMAATLVRVLAPLPVIVALSNIFGIQTLIPAGKNREFSFVLVSASIFGLAAILFLVSCFGVIGAAIAMLVVEVYVTLFMATFLKRMGFFSK